MLRPNKSEKEFLSLAYNSFYDLFDEIIRDEFWENSKEYRFCKIKNIFFIYSELLNYEPLRETVNWMKEGGRPPMEGEIADALFKFVRNTITHFPYFANWDSVWISKSIVNWNKKGQTIDRFLEDYKGQREVKYRFWESEKKKMTYLVIRFPNEYNQESKVFLKDIITEREGVKFSIILMQKILNTQVEEIK